MDMAETVQPEDTFSLDYSHFITEDEKPVDNRFAERQQRLLPHILFASWEEGRPFEALSDVGLFYKLENSYPVVPNFMLSLDVEPMPLTSDTENRSYLTWVYGKPPDLVVEVVSNKVGEELGKKLEIYRDIRITYYAVYDPFLKLGTRPLRVFQLSGGRYVEMLQPHWLPEIQLGLTLWDGVIEDAESRWLRFVDADGELLLTGEELARRAKAEAEDAKAELEAARQELEREREKVRQLEDRLGD
jgi:Uma2 family endonuclease